MKFSLIVATVGRELELRRLFDSLANQRNVDFQVIVVDQSSDGSVLRALNDYRGRLDIRRVLQSQRMVSKARNTGLDFAYGDVVAFPDDDCWYPVGLLKTVEEFFTSNPDREGLTGRAADTQLRDIGGHWLKTAGPVAKGKVWQQGIEYTMFFRREVCEAVGCFDESLGIGSDSKWQSGEGTDYLLKVLEAGYEVWYDPAVVVHHPSPGESPGHVELERVRGYAMGMGHVMRRHGFAFPQVVRYSAISLLGACLALVAGNPKRARVRWQRALGRLIGWFHG